MPFNLARGARRRWHCRARRRRQGRGTYARVSRLLWASRAARQKLSKDRPAPRLYLALFLVRARARARTRTREDWAGVLCRAGSPLACCHGPAARQRERCAPLRAMPRLCRPFKPGPQPGHGCAGGLRAHARQSTGLQSLPARRAHTYRSRTQRQKAAGCLRMRFDDSSPCPRLRLQRAIAVAGGHGAAMRPLRHKPGWSYKRAERRLCCIFLCHACSRQLRANRGPAQPLGGSGVAVY
jgi:hypothetical protein